jgi:hypothetical protein
VGTGTLAEGRRRVTKTASCTNGLRAINGTTPPYSYDRGPRQQRSGPHERDRCETVPVDEERERPHDPGGPSGEGAPPGDPDYHLHTELGEETKRLATHPREEAHRLVEELREGETETTPLIALSGLVLWLGVLVAIVIALVFLIAGLAS